MHVSLHRIQFLMLIFIIFVISPNAILILTIHFIYAFRILVSTPSIPRPLDTSIHLIIRASLSSFDIELLIPTFLVHVDQSSSITFNLAMVLIVLFVSTPL